MRAADLSAATVERYLRRLGMEHPGEPSLAGLRALHRAHVERIPYEVLDIQLGRPTSADPRYAIPGILRGRGGYCVQLNGAFATLLTALGYELTWHAAYVHASRKAPASLAPSPPHLAPTVRLDGETWFVDVGLGDGLHDPLPLAAGSYRQGPYTFQLSPSSLLPGGWRFDHDPAGAIAGLDFPMSPADLTAFTDWHPYLATSTESRLVRTVAVMRRDADVIRSLVGCVLRRVDAGGRSQQEIATAPQWYAVLADEFGLSLDDITPDQRADLWRRVRQAHERWLAARAAKAS